MIETIIWVIVGSVIFTITLWVLKHVCRAKYGRGIEVIADPKSRPKVTVGLLIPIFIGSFTPHINCLLFITGIIVLIIGYAMDDIRFINLPKWLINIINILKHEIRY